MCVHEQLKEFGRVHVRIMRTHSFVSFVQVPRKRSAKDTKNGTTMKFAKLSN
jgi:hypothetical protein